MMAKGEVHGAMVITIKLIVRMLIKMWHINQLKYTLSNISDYSYQHLPFAIHQLQNTGPYLHYNTLTIVNNAHGKNI